VKRRVFGLIVVVIILVSTSTRVGAKDVFQSTKLLELNGSTQEFCFVIQVNDLAYVAVAHDQLPKSMVVGDPIEVKIKDEKIVVKAKRFKRVNYDGDVNARIVVRKRMTSSDTTLPTCALSVKIH
jgi:hypothetical protein